MNEVVEIGRLTERSGRSVENQFPPRVSRSPGEKGETCQSQWERSALWMASLSLFPYIYPSNNEMPLVPRCFFSSSSSAFLGSLATLRGSEVWGRRRKVSSLRFDSIPGSRHRRDFQDPGFAAWRQLRRPARRGRREIKSESLTTEVVRDRNWHAENSLTVRPNPVMPNI